jgi:flagellar basal body P-ring formation protein FlgA
MYSMLLLAAASAVSFEDLEMLDDRIWAVEPHAEATDKRLKLVQCPDDPTIASAQDGTVVVRCTALGWRLRVPVKQAASAAETGEILIRKGELVECVSGGPGFSVSVPMVALEDAGVGQPVRVKSPSSPLTVTAYVKARGIVSF